MKYMTVINKQTKKCVPFILLPNGEVQITSMDPNNNEETCVVTLSDCFQEYSIDYGEHFKKI